MPSSILEGKKFEVVTLGCRANHYEAEAIASMLAERGALYAKPYTSPDIVVAVTCSITSVADSKTRKIIRRLRRKYPFALLAATGCYVQGHADSDIFALGADVCVGNRLKHRIPAALEAFLESGVPVGERADLFETEPVWDGLSLDRPRIHTRAFIKVQEGCDRRCSYCIVPSLRGPGVSRDLDDTRREILQVASAGCKEIVLTGIHLGSYRCGSASLAKLVSDISGILGVERLRLGSIEPFSIGDDLLAALADSSVFCRHIHLPIQSGDDEILRRMGRGHSASDLSLTAARIRSYLGCDIHLSTDLIVGFPGESDAAFERSLSLLDELGFGKIHVFPFSPREGTPAASMSGAPNRAIVRERVDAATQLSAKLLDKYAKTWVTRSDSVLVELRHKETRKGWVVSGLTRNYLRSYLNAEGDGAVGEIVPFAPKITEKGILLGDGVDRELLSELPHGFYESI